jgi:DNA invertase Pin-like site-specific DNA recombinase
MLTVLGGMAEFERELIRARTGEGRARAKASGQSLSRPFKLTPHRRYNVHPSTISRLTASFYFGAAIVKVERFHLSLADLGRVDSAALLPI